MILAESVSISGRFLLLVALALLAFLALAVAHLLVGYRVVRTVRAGAPSTSVKALAAAVAAIDGFLVASFVAGLAHFDLSNVVLLVAPAAHTVALVRPPRP